MQQNWKAVAEAFKTSRLALGLSQEELAAKANTSRSTVQLIERGPARQRISRAMSEVTAALGWPDGYIDQLLAGEVAGPPPRRQRTAEPESSPPRSDLPLAVAHELGLGDLIDSQVVELGDSDARMIIVVRGAEGATPEKIRQALEEWRHVAQKLQMGETSAG